MLLPPTLSSKLREEYGNRMRGKIFRYMPDEASNEECDVYEEKYRYCAFMY
jgi:hypothetical protein